MLSSWEAEEDTTAQRQVSSCRIPLLTTNRWPLVQKLQQVHLEKLYGLGLGLDLWLADCGLRDLVCGLAGFLILWNIYKSMLARPMWTT